MPGKDLTGITGGIVGKRNVLGRKGGKEIFLE